MQKYSQTRTKAACRMRRHKPEADERLRKTKEDRATVADLSEQMVALWEDAPAFPVDIDTQYKRAGRGGSSE
ncbi:hypothetical protein AOR01nite_25970 [Acetobacter orleanensis]|uniref:Uncharacterized protein n=1 Tax=Acetobacter orleanensis TaxID=104099 RepID=A0A4Y3TT40_9PROT|nr:hypothetical protein AOR01nite_25970 [Acetobacter orleanensis]